MPLWTVVVLVVLFFAGAIFGLLLAALSRSAAYEDGYRDGYMAADERELLVRRGPATAPVVRR